MYLWKQTKPEIKEALNFCQAFVEKRLKTVAENLEKGIEEEHPTLLSLLYQSSKAENSNLTHQDILDEAIFIMVAGNIPLLFVTCIFSS